MSSDMEYIIEKELSDQERENINELMKNCRYGIAYATRTNYANGSAITKKETKDD